MRSDDDLRRDKSIARTMSGLFIVALAIALFAADQMFIHSGYSRSIWTTVALVSAGLVSYVAVGWAVEQYWRGRGKR